MYGVLDPDFDEDSAFYALYEHEAAVYGAIGAYPTELTGDHPLLPHKALKPEPKPKSPLEALKSITERHLREQFIKELHEMNQPLDVFDRRRPRSLAADAMAELGGLMPPSISIKGNRFALVDAAGIRYPVNTLHLDCVIIDVNPHKSKIYWGDTPYDPNDADRRPPLCFSDNGIAPSANAQEQQARTCAECRHNEWSKINEVTGNRNKPCSDRKKLAVFVVGHDGMPYQLQIPPATLKTLSTYSGYLQSLKPPGKDRKADLNDVVTRVSFVDNKNGELQFKPVAWITSLQSDVDGGWRLAVNEQGQVIESDDRGMAFGDAVENVIDSGVTDDIVGKNDRPWSGGALAAPTSAEPVRKVPAPAPQVAPPPPAAPRSAAPSHGGARPGAGRRPKLAPPQEVIAPSAAVPQSPSPSPFAKVEPSRAPAQPVALQTPFDDPLQGPTNPAFAKPQDMPSQVSNTLDFAMGLNTQRK